MALTDALRQSFVAGLILLAPLVVTVYVLRVLALWSLAFVNPVVQQTRLTQYTANIELVAQIVAVVLIVGADFASGFTARGPRPRFLFPPVPCPFPPSRLPAFPSPR
jgi:uncharacterized membrane protein